MKIGIEPFNEDALFTLASNADNSQGIAEFREYLNKIDETFRFEEGDDTALIIPTLYQQYEKCRGTNLVEEITSCALEFLSKITKESLETFTPMQHKSFLAGPISYRGRGGKSDFSVKIISEMIKMGFDPGVAVNHEDAFQIAVQQTQNQAGKGGGVDVINASKYIATDSDGLLFSDNEMIKLFFLSGKIFGYEGDKGIEEARKIEALGENVPAIKSHLNVFFKRTVPHREPNFTEVPIISLTNEFEAEEELEIKNSLADETDSAFKKKTVRFEKTEFQNTPLMSEPEAGVKIETDKVRKSLKEVEEETISGITEIYLTRDSERKNMLYPNAKVTIQAETNTPNPATEITSVTVLQRFCKFFGITR